MDLKKIKKHEDSFYEFLKNTKIGNIEFENDDDVYLVTKEIIPLVLDIRITFDSKGFYCFLGESKDIQLTATTAQEAAAEAIELCRKEAQKLVDLLSEPKDEIYTEHFLEWRNKIFNEYKGEKLSWVMKNDGSKKLTNTQVVSRYELAFKTSLTKTK